MGHVPTGEVPTARTGADFPRREHRRAGARRSPLSACRVGELGERIAADYLTRRGFSVVGRNVRVGRGEIDILMERDGRRVAVEVKSAWVGERSIDGRDPVDRFDEAKAAQVSSLAAALGVWRVDLVAVAFNDRGVQIRWIPATV